MKNKFFESFLLAIAISIGIFIYSLNPIPFLTSMSQANEALKHVQEVSKWMATVQIGILTALGAILALDNSRLDKTISIYSFTFLISSLIFSSIVLTGIPSISLRLADPNFLDSKDVLIYPIYAKACEHFHLGLFVSLQQWFWAGSLIFILWLIALTIHSKRENNTNKQKN